MRSASYSALSPWPDFGINFETAFVARLNETGYANDDGSDDTAVEFIGMGTERGMISNAGPKNQNEVLNAISTQAEMIISFTGLFGRRLTTPLTMSADLRRASSLRKLPMFWPRRTSLTSFETYQWSR